MEMYVSLFKRNNKSRRRHKLRPTPSKRLEEALKERVRSLRNTLVRSTTQFELKVAHLLGTTKTLRHLHQNDDVLCEVAKVLSREDCRAQPELQSPAAW